MVSLQHTHVNNNYKRHRDLQCQTIQVTRLLLEKWTKTGIKQNKNKYYWWSCTWWNRDWSAQMCAVVFAEATVNRHLSEKDRSAAICKHHEEIWIFLVPFLYFTRLHKMQISPACFQQCWRIGISQKQQQHRPVDTKSRLKPIHVQDR